MNDICEKCTHCQICRYVDGVASIIEVAKNVDKEIERQYFPLNVTWEINCEYFEYENTRETYKYFG